MNYQGMPCKVCGEIINVYSLSGKCRRCFHKRKRKKMPASITVEEHISNMIKKHRTDLYHYHVLTIDRISVAEHRYLWEKAYKKSLPKGWIVHHLNGLPGDNRIENLVAMPRTDHETHMINILKARIRKLEEL